jgi:hypothetical protein
MVERAAYTSSISRYSLLFYCKYKNSREIAAHALRILLACADAVRHQIWHSDSLANINMFWNSVILRTWSWMLVGDSAFMERVKNQRLWEHWSCYVLHYFLCFCCCRLSTFSFPFPCLSLFSTVLTFLYFVMTIFLLSCLIFMLISFDFCACVVSDFKTRLVRIIAFYIAHHLLSNVT